MKVYIVVTFVQVISAILVFAHSNTQDALNIIRLASAIISYMILTVGILAWRKCYKILKIFMFISSVKSVLELGYIVYILISSIILLNANINPYLKEYLARKFF